MNQLNKQDMQRERQFVKEYMAELIEYMGMVAQDSGMFKQLRDAQESDSPLRDLLDRLIYENEKHYWEINLAIEELEYYAKQRNL